MAGFITRTILYYVALWKKSTAHHQTQEEYEAEYAARQDLKSEMIAIAQDVYQKSPVGHWRYVVHSPMAEPESDEFPVARKKRYGEGRYLAITATHGAFRYSVKAPALQIESTFLVKNINTDKCTFEIQLTVPPLPGWFLIRYGFEAAGRPDHFDVVLWLEADNPLPPDLHHHWPFLGTFVREKETAESILNVSAAS